MNTDDFIIIDCPHCSMMIVVKKNEINCKIFRCGIFKHNNQQIPPHETKENCDKYKQQDLIYGCSKPFMLDDELVPRICGYI